MREGGGEIRGQLHCEARQHWRRLSARARVRAHTHTFTHIMRQLYDNGWYGNVSWRTMKSSTWTALSLLLIQIDRFVLDYKLNISRCELISNRFLQLW